MADEPERLDAPNQQVVRGDASGPAVEGTGGSKRADDAEEAPKKRGPGRPKKNAEEEEE